MGQKGGLFLALIILSLPFFVLGDHTEIQSTAENVNQLLEMIVDRLQYQIGDLGLHHNSTVSQLYSTLDEQKYVIQEKETLARELEEQLKAAQEELETEQEHLEDLTTEVKLQEQSLKDVHYDRIERIQKELTLVRRIQEILEMMKNRQFCSVIRCPLGSYCFNNTCLEPTSCTEARDLGIATKSGFYYIKPSSFESAHKVWCSIQSQETWTMVWSNVRGGSNKPETGMNWNTATTASPIYWGNSNGNSLLDEWKVFIGLEHWRSLTVNNKLRYDWTPIGDVVTHRAECSFSLDGSHYTINLANCKLLKGDILPGLVTAHNGRRFQTFDNRVNQCGTYYTSTPWWYGQCWSGSINGGGENMGNGYYNGAYWTHSSKSWAVHGSHHGAGNGWIYVQ